MTRKHFEALALALKNAKPVEGAFHLRFTYAMAQWRADVRAIAEVLLAWDRWFNTPQFYAACGYEIEGVKS